MRETPRKTTFDHLEAARSLLLYECLQPAHDDDWIGVTLATSSIAVGSFAHLTAHLDDRDRARKDADALLMAATGAWLAVHDRMVDRPTASQIASASFASFLCALT